MSLKKEQLITKDKLDELETAHGRIAHVRCKEDPNGDTPWEVVLRKPKRNELKLYRAHSLNPATQAEAQENLVKKICVYPSFQELENLLEDGWLIGEACGSAINKLTGLGTEAETK